jgi:hypothetical protein
LHIINGQTHGPGTANNLALGSTGDNNLHRGDVEDHIRNGLAAADTATTYAAQIVATPPFAIEGNVAYWNNAALNMPGAVAGAGHVITGGKKKAYTHSANQAHVPAETRWAHYTVAPVYGAALSPTIRANMATVYKAKHVAALNTLDAALIAPLATLAKRQKARIATGNARTAVNLGVTAATLNGGVGAALLAVNAAAQVFITAKFGGVAASLAYTATMLTNHNNMVLFGNWAAAAFPSSFTCDADLYHASYDPARIWYKRSEAQTPVNMNQN